MRSLFFVGLLAAPFVNSALIEVDFFHGCAVNQGNVWCWGRNVNLGVFDFPGIVTATFTDTPQMIDNNTLFGVSQVAVAVDYSCAIANFQSEILCWGFGSIVNGMTGKNNTECARPQRTMFSLEFPITAISASSTHTCAIANGKAYCWGLGYDGNLGANVGFTPDVRSDYPILVPLPSNVTVISTYSNPNPGSSTDRRAVSCAIANKKAYCWGANGFGQLGSTNSSSSVPLMVPLPAGSGEPTFITTGNQRSCAVAGNDGYCWGLDVTNGVTRTPAKVPSPLGTLKISQMVVGLPITQYCAVTTGGNLYSWGFPFTDQNGQLGIGGGLTQPNATSPTQVAVISSRVFEVSMGINTICAFADKPYCWGKGTAGELGSGSSTNSNRPVPLSLLTTLSTPPPTDTRAPSAPVASPVFTPTIAPSGPPTGAPVTLSPETDPPTSRPPTAVPTGAPVTNAPVMPGAPTSSPVTTNPPTAPPTSPPTQPPTSPPTQPPVTSPPVTSPPSAQPTSKAPTGVPTSATPTAIPTTGTPTAAPTTPAPTPPSPSVSPAVPQNSTRFSGTTEFSVVSCVFNKTEFVSALEAEFADRGWDVTVAQLTDANVLLGCASNTTNVTDAVITSVNWTLTSALSISDDVAEALADEDFWPAVAQRLWVLTVPLADGSGVIVKTEYNPSDAQNCTLSATFTESECVSCFKTRTHEIFQSARYGGTCMNVETIGCCSPTSSPTPSPTTPAPTPASPSTNPSVPQGTARLTGVVTFSVLSCTFDKTKFKQELEAELATEGLTVNVTTPTDANIVLGCINETSVAVNTSVTFEVMTMLNETDDVAMAIEDETLWTGVGSRVWPPATSSGGRATVQKAEYNPSDKQDCELSVEYTETNCTDCRKIRSFQVLVSARNGGSCSPSRSIDCCPKDELSDGEIAGAVIGSVFGFLLIVLLIMLICRAMSTEKEQPTEAFQGTQMASTKPKDVNVDV